MALFLARQKHNAKRITLQALERGPSGPSPLEQIESAYPAYRNKAQAGPATTAARQPNQGSARLSSSTSPRGSVSSTSSKIRRSSGTSFLSRITLSPDLHHLVTDIKAIDKLPRSVERATCDELSYIPKGNLIRLRLSRFPLRERPQKNSNKYLNIPLKFLDYDRNDKLAIQLIRARDFRNGSIQVTFSLCPKTETALVYGRPVLSFISKEVWSDVSGALQVVEYIEDQPSANSHDPTALRGRLRVRNKFTGHFWIRGDHVNMHNFWANEGCREIDDYVAAGEGSRGILRQWIKQGRLILKDVRINTLGRPIGGTLDLSGKVFDPYFDSDSDEEWDN